MFKTPNHRFDYLTGNPIVYIGKDALVLTCVQTSQHIDTNHFPSQILHCFDWPMKIVVVNIPIETCVSCYLIEVVTLMCWANFPNKYRFREQDVADKKSFIVGCMSSAASCRVIRLHAFHLSPDCVGVREGWQVVMRPCTTKICVILPVLVFA